LENEIAILRLLQHPNVIHLYGVYESSEAIYLIFEYINGEVLQNAIYDKRRFLNEKQVAVIMEGILKGLDYCHKEGYIHRDIKPANLLIKYTL